MKLQMGHLSLLSATLVIPFEVFGEWYTGGGVIYGLVDADVTYDSNIHTNSSEVQSVIYTLTPGVQYIRTRDTCASSPRRGRPLALHGPQALQFAGPVRAAFAAHAVPRRGLPARRPGDRRVCRPDDARPHGGPPRRTHAAPGRRRSRLPLPRILPGSHGGSYEYYDYEVSSDPDFPPAQGGAYPTSNLAALELGGAYRYSPT
jgi:hypothetical protein